MHRRYYRKRLRQTFRGAYRWTPCPPLSLLWSICVVRCHSVTSGEIQKEGTTDEGFFRKVLEQCMDFRDSHR